MKRELGIPMIGLALGLGTSLLAPAVSTAAPSFAQSTIYRLEPGSTYQEGCFEPCLCPIMLEAPMRGTYALKLVNSNPMFDTYAVSQVNWTYTPVGTDEDIHITGSGTYTIGGEVAFLQRLELDLNIGDEPTQHFDSGWVDGANDFPAINVTVSINGMYCYDTVLVIKSKPLPKKAISNYNLLGDSTFQQGCFDPCDCLLEKEQPLVGSFGLTKILDYGTYHEYAIVNVKLKTPASTPFGGHTLTGSGTLVTIDGFAGPIHRLQLYLSLDGGPLQHFDSGLVNSEVFFPEIDAVVTINDMVCYDVVLHIHAKSASSPFGFPVGSPGGGTGLD